MVKNKPNYVNNKGEGCSEPRQGMMSAKHREGLKKKKRVMCKIFETQNQQDLMD